ncbi:PREDICTED: putative protein TPRXL [Camelina sativa]|uniref:Uncharacterized protein n=1 Tax=Camelina sativa TaxID=90675 RepID=A0ABM1R484_CAMSA|nr:PREDICTED: putative protein TPRXL [Camelina sativa]
MAENVGSDSSELGSITSSQQSYLKNCPFAGHEASPTNSDNTEILSNKISPAVVKTPVLSFSSPTSLDSIKDDVFRTPPENASPSSAADSEPGVRVSEMKSHKGSNFKSPYSNAETTLLSSPPSENFRFSQSNSKSPSSTAATTPVSASPSGKVRALKKNSKSPSSNAATTPGSHSPSGKVRVLETNSKSPSSTAVTTPVSASPSGKVRVLETNLKSPSSTAEMTPVSAPPSEKVRVLDTNRPFDFMANRALKSPPQRVVNFGSASATEGTKVSETEDSGEVIPFKEIIEALLRNSGEKLDERDENVSCVDILKSLGLKFP